MFGGYEDRAELEDELYGEESEGSEVDDSELEFRLYSQLHYSSNPGEREEEEEEEEKRLSSSHGEKEGDGCKAKRRQPSQSHDHGNRDLRQQLLGDTEQKNQKVKGKTQRGTKQQRGLSRGDPKGQRSFQEVIVIDLSHDDVITVSDNTEEDDGVCSAKGQRSKTGPLQASTPAPQRNSAPKRRSSSVDSDTVVVLDSESGAESGSESGAESGSESDSDCLESWMVLGSGKQDGDQSIILNLEGEGDAIDGDDEGSWLITDKDRGAQIINRRGGGPPVRRLANRYYVDKNVTCHSCNKTGHLSKNCPTAREPCCMLCGEQGHRMSTCPSKHCYNCGLPGHMYEACVEPNLRYKQCHRCGVHGHLNDACPEIWRQYHITTKAGPVVKGEGWDNATTTSGQHQDNATTTPPYCYNCSLRGHFGFDCSARRMFGGVLPNSPFINHYDTPRELSKRDHRTLLRVKELKDAGLFQCQFSPDGGARDEPPGKRQRTNSKDSYGPYQNYPPKPYHLPPYRSAAPNRTHIRFSHGQEKPWTPKHKLKETREGKHVTPASATPKSNMADRNQPGSQKGQKKKQRKPAKNKMAAGADESLDFPRGQGPSPKSKKKGPPSSAGAPPTFHPKGSASHNPDRLFGAEKKKKQKKKKRENGRNRKAVKEEEMYPKDENLFLIKQRRPRR
ncbi:hypothetical protein J4Q44_G00037560 [Coregonus suidteri]|uniref:Zinc finger CCHC domain-containing protein 7 n=1 Tax=Coregonus suidteri TaxID=861788 RepID=A0AAN8M840_9TELE